LIKLLTYKNAFTKRLFKNKGAIFGIVVIVIAFVVAVFAYFIAPDGSPYANRIVPEIGNKKAGFTIQLVQIKKDSDAVSHTNFFEKLINGEPDAYSFVPVTSFIKTKDSIIAQKFIDDGITERTSFPLNKLAAIPVIKQKFTLGTDKFGRDIASRLIVGTRVSLSVGMIAVVISLTIGILLGALAGYFKGSVDDVIMWLINVIWSIPTLLLVFAITLLLGKGFFQVFFAVGLTMWVNVARLVRGQVLAVRELEYIEAARALGFSHTRTIA